MAYSGPATRRTGVYCHEHWEAVGYPLLSSNYNYDIDNIFVEATLTEVYQCQSNVERQVSYLFQVPPEASVTGFSAQVGTRRIDAVIEEIATARQKYNTAVSQGAQAYKLEKANDEVLTIALGNVSPNSKITIRVTYAYIISSDTTDDSVRLTIPMGLADRPGSGPSTYTTVPTAPSGSDAVTITIGIQVQLRSQIQALTCLSHNATVTYGFKDASFKTLKPIEKMNKAKPYLAYVEFSTKTFPKNHFVLTYDVPYIDWGQCVVEQLSNPAPGKPATIAYALTLVPNIKLNEDRHEFIFLVDNSGSMSGSRTTTANRLLNTMLDKLPKATGSSFNLFYFNTSAWSATGRSLPVDTTNVNTAKSALRTYASGGTDINRAIQTVLSQRDPGLPRSSIIVITDGLDWGVTAAAKTVSDAVNRSGNVRVFVLGVGDDVSHAMCEALARAGAGATAYIAETDLLDNDKTDKKAYNMIGNISRSPILVRRVNWNVLQTTDSTSTSGIGDSSDSRPDLDDSKLGPAAKGDNLPPPDAIQQSPKPGTLFWSLRSSWFAIIRGSVQQLEVEIEYDVPGVVTGKSKKIDVDLLPDGRKIHTLAARALIQDLEEKQATLTDSTSKYYNEAQIIRLGKTYSLLSSQTAFIATSNGIGTTTTVNSAAPPGANSTLSASAGPQSAAHFGTAQNVPASSPIAPSANASPFVSFRAAAVAPREGPSFDSGPLSAPAFGAPPPVGGAPADDAKGGTGALQDLLKVQNDDGSFPQSDVERIVFPSSGIPELSKFIARLDGRPIAKDQIWVTLLAAAFFVKKFNDRESDWSAAKAKALKFAETTLCCIYGIQGGLATAVVNGALKDADGYIS